MAGKYGEEDSMGEAAAAAVAATSATSAVSRNISIKPYRNIYTVFRCTPAPLNFLLEKNRTTSIPAVLQKQELTKIDRASTLISCRGGTLTYPV